MKSVHQKNNWEFLSKVYEDYQNFPGTYRPLRLLNDVYKNMYPNSEQALVGRGGEARIGNSSPLETLTLLVGSGVYPPPELLIWLDECFSYYFDAEGDVSLEHIFFGREKPRIGNASRRSARTSFYSGFSSVIRVEEYKAQMEGRTVRSMSELAEEYLNSHWSALKHLKDKELDSESFLRSWRRWQSSQDK